MKGITAASPRQAETIVLLNAARSGASLAEIVSLLKLTDLSDDADRIRECQVCQKIFFAAKSNAKRGCSLAHSNVARVRAFRQRKEDQTTVRQ